MQLRAVVLCELEPITQKVGKSYGNYPFFFMPSKKEKLSKVLINHTLIDQAC